MTLPKVQFDMKVSLGNLITIAGGVFVLLVGWVTMQNDIRNEREARLITIARLDRLESKDEFILRTMTDGQRETISGIAELKAQVAILLRRDMRGN